MYLNVCIITNPVIDNTLIVRVAYSRVGAAITLFEWRGPAGSTPLMVAAQRGSVKCLKLLLRAGARLDPTDTKVSSDYHRADNQY